MTDTVVVDEEAWLLASAPRKPSRRGRAGHAAGPRPGQHVRDVVGRHAEEVILDVRTLTHPLPPAPHDSNVLICVLWWHIGGAAATVY